MAISLFSLPFLLLVPIIFIIVNHITTFLFSKRHGRLPPGPMPWPIIGNVPHINKRLHVALAKIAKVHGPIISLKFSSQLVIVGSSAIAASEILKNQDRLLSSRSIPKAIPVETHVLERIAIVWNPRCNDHWKRLRVLCRTELFSAKAIESQASLREKKLSELIQFLGNKQGQVVTIGEVVFATVFNTISNLLFSKDFFSLEDGGMGRRLKSLVRKSIDLATTPNLADFYPILRNLDPQGLKRKLSKCVKEMFGEWEIYIKERRERRANNHAVSNNDFLDVFLSNGFDDDQINWLVLELFFAGAETTTTAVEWAMAELLKNKQAMNKICQELDREINTNSIHESQLSQLSYLNACVKETLRLHPPLAILTHHTYDNCEVMNYTIPKGSQVFVNVWAIGRDPSAWEDPLSFKPERFMGSSLDLKGNDFGYLPFGSGRRICPGMPMAIRQVPLILISLIHCFNWSLPNDEDPAMLDMTYGKFGITAPKEKPLVLVPKRKF